MVQLDSEWAVSQDYATCDKTFVTLRVYSDSLVPGEISDRLGLIASDSFTKGTPTNPTSKTPVIAKFHGWFLSSEDAIDSPDAREHVDWLLNHLLPCADALRSLLNEECRIDVSCYWRSKSGHGGPTLSKRQLEGLALLGVDFWYDFYS